MSKVQIYINMASALVIFLGGMAVVVFFPSHLSGTGRFVIGLLVSLYFLLRMGQSLLLLKRRRQMSEKGLSYLAEELQDTEDGPKRP